MTCLRTCLGLITLVLLLASTAVPVKARSSDPLVILSYHDIRDDVADQGDPDGFAIHSQHFAAHLDWLSGNGYHPISLQQLIDAVDLGTPLPPKPILLTFDDGLRSLWTHAFPLLQAYGYPAVAAVVTSWVDLPEGEQVDYGHRMFGPDDFVTWAQLRTMQASGLVEIASHSHDLHRGVPANPHGNQTPAAVTRIYDPQHGYESEASYRQRIDADLRRSSELIEQHLGRAPRSIVWPYAAYSGVGNEIADALGMRVSFDLQGPSAPVTDTLHGLARLLVMNNPGVADLVNELRRERDIAGMRALQIDLDAVYDDDPAQIDRNLDALIERVNRIGPSHVFLQAFADPDGNGSADALYFPNRHLPMRADLFSRVAWQLLTRSGTEVYAWMPVLGFEPPDPQQRRALAIASREDDGIYRLDFTQPDARRLILDLYEDLAASSYMAGLLFHDDAYLRDHELTDLAPDDARARTLALIAFTDELKQAAERWRPKLASVRNLYARPVLEPESEAWFAQQLDAFLGRYDRVALMAMPWMEGAPEPQAWLDRLQDRVASHEDGLARTIFQVQTVDWRQRQPIEPELLRRKLLRLQARGARHLAWYPDDAIADRPPWPMARASMSARSFPYELR